MCSVNSEFSAIILFSPTAIKKNICDVKNSHMGHDLPTALSDSDFARVSFSRTPVSFLRTAHLGRFAKIKLAKISEITVTK